MAHQLAMGSLPSTDFAGNAERFAAVDDAFGGLLRAMAVEMPQPLFMTIISTGNSLPGRVLQIMQVAKSPSADPDVAADDDGDAVAAMAFLHQRRARRHGELDLDHRADRNDVPWFVRIMAGEIAAQRKRIGGRHGHLADAVDQRHAHGHHGGAVAIVQVEEIEGGPSPFLDLQAEAGVECFLAGAADPEIALAGLAHLDHPLFHGAGAHHEAMDLQAAITRQRQCFAAVAIEPRPRLLVGRRRCLAHAVDSWLASETSEPRPLGSGQPQTRAALKPKELPLGRLLTCAAQLVSVAPDSVSIMDHHSSR